MDNILITGGTGTLGKQIIKQLHNSSTAIKVLTTKENSGIANGVHYLKADLTTPDSLPAAVNDTQVVIHCASNPPNAKQVDLEGTRNLLAAIDKSKIKHFIYVSIAGVDKSQFPYYIIKHEVEQLIKAAGIPFTILRATQFHDFVLYRMIKPYDTAQGLTIPAGLRFQSIAIGDVVNKIAALLSTGPTNDTITIGGPQVLKIEEMAKAYLTTLGRTTATLKTEMMEGERFDMLRSGINLCEGHRFGHTTWQQYLTNLANNNNLQA